MVKQCSPFVLSGVVDSSFNHRRGALHLMAAFSVADGLVYGQCHPRRRFVDFRSFLETIVIAEAHRRGVQKVALVLDNGPTHASKQLPGFVEELARASEGKLRMQLSWLPVNASWLDQIEIWFSLLQRKLLQPNHFTNLNELEQAIQDFILHYNQNAKPLKWSYTVEQLERKLGTNSRLPVLSFLSLLMGIGMVLSTVSRAIHP